MPRTLGLSSTKIVRTQVRVPGLDGLRGIAIILVMLFHLTYLHPSSLIDHLFLGFTHYGWAGVDLFSGFLITGILLDAKAAPNYFPIPTVFGSVLPAQLFPASRPIRGGRAKRNLRISSR